MSPKDFIGTIVEECAFLHKVTASDVRRGLKFAPVVRARHAAIREVAATYPTWRPQRIAAAMGVSYATVLYAMQQHANLDHVKKFRALIMGSKLSMTKEEFAAIRKRLGLSVEELSRALRLREDGGRTIRRMEAGGALISGPVTRLMIAFDLGQVQPLAEVERANG